MLSSFFGRPEPSWTCIDMYNQNPVQVIGAEPSGDPDVRSVCKRQRFCRQSLFGFGGLRWVLTGRPSVTESLKL